MDFIARLRICAFPSEQVAVATIPDSAYTVHVVGDRAPERAQYLEERAKVCHDLCSRHGWKIYSLTMEQQFVLLCQPGW